MTKMKLVEIIEAGTQAYQVIYNQTMMGSKSLDRQMECPPYLRTVAEHHPDAVVIVHGDDTLVIEDSHGVRLYVESPCVERPGQALPYECWHYINMAMGREEYRHEFDNE